MAGCFFTEAIGYTQTQKNVYLIICWCRGRYQNDIKHLYYTYTGTSVQKKYIYRNVFWCVICVSISIKPSNVGKVKFFYFVMFFRSFLDRSRSNLICWTFPKPSCTYTHCFNSSSSFWNTWNTIYRSQGSNHTVFHNNKILPISLFSGPLWG